MPTLPGIVIIAGLFGALLALVLKRYLFGSPLRLENSLTIFIMSFFASGTLFYGAAAVAFSIWNKFIWDLTLEEFRMPLTIGAGISFLVAGVQLFRLVKDP